MKFKSPMPRRPVVHFLGFVYSQIVHNYMDHLVFRTIAIQLLKEIKKFYPGVALFDLSDHPAALDHKGGKQTDGTVAFVFKLPFSTATRPFLLVGVLTAKGLNSGLFVNAHK